MTQKCAVLLGPNLVISGVLGPILLIISQKMVVRNTIFNL